MKTSQKAENPKKSSDLNPRPPECKSESKTYGSGDSLHVDWLAFKEWMSKYLSEAEINFIAGRISGSVFMTNYFNPAMITDLKQRVFNAIKEIEAKIS